MGTTGWLDEQGWREVLEQLSPDYQRRQQPVDAEWWRKARVPVSCAPAIGVHQGCGHEGGR
jgi:hypothetical protein